MADYHRNQTAGPQLTSTGATITFRSLKDDFAALRAAAPSGIVNNIVLSIGKSEQAQDIHAIRIGKNPAMPVLIAGCHHAREWISVEMPYMIAEYLINNYNGDEKVRRIVDSRDIWIVPMVNPDGHERSVLTERLWRKNFPGVAGRDSVDPNRNYATTTWSEPLGAFSTDPAADTYKGPSAGYAKEVIAMQNLITTNQFKGSLDYHSFGRWVLFPWSGRTGTHPDANQNTMAGHLERVIDGRGTDYDSLQASHFYRQPPWSRSPDRAKIPGGMMDYVVENVPDSIAITVELEPDRTDPRGFVLPSSEIQSTFDTHLGSILTFLNCIGTLPSAPATRNLVLTPGSANDFSVFRTDCSRVFETY